MKILDSPVIKDFVDEGKLPTFNISLDTKTIIQMCVGLLLVAVLAILAYQAIEAAKK